MPRCVFPLDIMQCAGRSPHTFDNSDKACSCCPDEIKMSSCLQSIDELCGPYWNNRSKSCIVPRLKANQSHRIACEILFLGLFRMFPQAGNVPQNIAATQCLMSSSPLWQKFQWVPMETCNPECGCPNHLELFTFLLHGCRCNWAVLFSLGLQRKPTCLDAPLRGSNVVKDKPQQLTRMFFRISDSLTGFYRGERSMMHFKAPKQSETTSTLSKRSPCTLFMLR